MALDFLLSMVFLGIVLSLAVWIKWCWNRRHLNAYAARIPGPPTLPVLGNAHQLMVGADKIMDTISNMVYKYGSVMKVWLGPLLNVIISDPKDVELLLMSSKALTRGPSYKYLQIFLGEGLLSSSGPIWRRHRKSLVPAFHSSRLDNFLGPIDKHCIALIMSLRNKSQEKEFNIFYDIVETTTDCVCDVIFGYSKNNRDLPHRNEIVRKNERMFEMVQMRTTKWLLQIEWLFQKTTLYKEQETHRAMVQSFTEAILADKSDNFEKSQGMKDSDLTPLDILLKGTIMSKKEKLDEIFTLFATSQESTATVISFTLLMLGMHQDYQDKVYNEINNIMGKDDHHVTISDLTSMIYLDMAVKEVMRLFPIAALLQRELFENFQIGSHTLPAGCSLVIPIYQIHRHPKYWDEPEIFNPERFTPENSASRHPMTYIPFSAGPMNCIGRSFAYLLIKTICCRVLKEFRVCTKQKMSELKTKVDLSVRPLNGYYVTLKSRQ